MHRRNINDEGYGSEGSGETLAFVWARGELGESTYRYLRLSQRKKTPDVPKHSKDDQADRCCFDDQTGRLLSPRQFTHRWEGDDSPLLRFPALSLRKRSAKPHWVKRETGRRASPTRTVAQLLASSSGNWLEAPRAPAARRFETARKVLTCRYTRTPYGHWPWSSQGHPGMIHQQVLQD
jgi:hypothetical protein